MSNLALCVTCGTQFSRPAELTCTICEEERQFVPPSGQAWTTLERLQRTHMAALRYQGGVLGIGTSPAFAINQRALLVRTPAGNVLWDCVSFIDEALIDIIRALGGLAAIAISHPHYYTTMLDWSRAFGGVPIYLHAADRQWVMRQGPEIEFWDGDAKPIVPGLTLVRAGGHFEGGQVLHWEEGIDGKGALLTGDIIQVTADNKFLAFMRSYPNFIPLSTAAVRSVAAAVESLRFDAIYGALWDRVVPHDAKRVLEQSVQRHIHWVERDVIVPSPS